MVRMIPHLKPKDRLEKLLAFFLTLELPGQGHSEVVEDALEVQPQQLPPIELRRKTIPIQHTVYYLHVCSVYLISSLIPRVFPMRVNIYRLDNAYLQQAQGHLEDNRGPLQRERVTE